jgi:hypothetical protein
MAGGWQSRLVLLIGAGCLCAVAAARGQAQTEGPVITFFGVANPDGSTTERSSVDEMGRDVFERILGHRFFLVIEARPGSNEIAVGGQTFEHEPGNVAERPDLQVLVSRQLGNGNAVVCELGGTGADGVPGIDPPLFAEVQQVTDAISDLGCHFIDDEGQTMGRTSARACTTSSTGTGAGFADPTSTLQFCAFIDVPIGFISGETAIAARVRDVEGNVGPATEIVLRVTGPTPTVTPTATQTGTMTPTATPTPSPTVTPLPCDGDCNRDRDVSTSELIIAVDIALGSADVARCLDADADGNGAITVDELATAVARSLGSCD